MKKNKKQENEWRSNQEVIKILQEALEEELEKEYADPRVLDLIERGRVITIKRD